MRSRLRRGDMAHLLDRASARPVATVQVEMVTAVYVYWRIADPAHPTYREGQSGRSFKHHDVVVPQAVSSRAGAR